MGDVHLETRLALLFLRVVSADGEASDPELAKAAEYLSPLLRQLGVKIDAGRLLMHTRKQANDDALLDETVQIFAESLPPEVLANIANQLGDAASADGASDEEAQLHESIISAWQLGDADAPVDGGDEDEVEDEEEEQT
jgi:uncharacterized tellurite resistance protein B-like protein